MSIPRYSVTVTPIPESSEVEISGEISASELISHRMAVLRKIREHADIPGFRKGHVPEAVLEKRVGEMAILQEMAEAALDRAYPEILKEERIDAIGYPQVSITKLASGNPLGFKLRTAVKPEVTLPDYRAIAETHRAKAVPVSLSDEEFAQALEKLREQLKKPGDESAPELTLELLEEKGLPHKTLEEFNTELRKQLLQERKQRAGEKLRLEIAEELVEKTKTIVPSILVEAELEKMAGQFADDLGRMGLNLDQYLKRVSKSLETLREEWRPDALKRAKLQLVLEALSVKEGIIPNEHQINHEVSHVLEHYPDLNPLRAKFRVETMLRNSMVFEFLETGERPDSEKIDGHHEH